MRSTSSRTSPCSSARNSPRALCPRSEPWRSHDARQRSALLPESLPEIDGLEIETLYAAAGELNEVGGDFYDVFDYGDARTMLVIGDVCGKGPRAAGVTALARHTLRAAAIGGQVALREYGSDAP